MILPFLILCLAIFGHGQGQTCPDGVIVTNGCSCYSGYTGTNCDTASNGTCPLPPASPLQTNSIGEFISGSISNNVLSFSVVSPAVSGRYFDYIQFSESTNCSYPGTNIVKDFLVSNCSDTFEASIPFANVANDCAFALTTTSSTDTYLGTLSVSVHEPVISATGQLVTRQILSSLLLELSLPTTVTFNVTTLLVYSEMTVDAVVSKQLYTRSSDIAVIEMTTFTSGASQLLVATPYLPFPFPSTGISVINPAVCSGPAESCEQITTFTLNGVQASGLCNLGGDYLISWTCNCRSGTPGCPYTEDQIVNITFTLSGSNLCGKMSVKAQLTGSLASYADSGASSSQSNFVEGTTSYFKLALTSDVTIQSITFNSVTAFDNSNSANVITLWSGSDVTSDGSLANFTTVSQVGSDLIFGFNPSADLFGDAPGSTVAFTVITNVQITYKTTFGKRKRDISTESYKFQGMGIILPGKPLRYEIQKESSFASSSNWQVFMLASIGLVVILVRRNFLSKNFRRVGTLFSDRSC